MDGEGSGSRSFNQKRRYAIGKEDGSLDSVKRYKVDSQRTTDENGWNLSACHHRSPSSHLAQDQISMPLTRHHAFRADIPGTENVHPDPLMDLNSKLQHHSLEAHRGLDFDTQRLSKVHEENSLRQLAASHSQRIACATLDDRASERQPPQSCMHSIASGCDAQRPGCSSELHGYTYIGINSFLAELHADQVRAGKRLPWQEEEDY